MRRLLAAAAIAAGLAGCGTVAQLLPQIEGVGDRAFDGMEDSSRLAGSAARRYLCQTIRVEALRQIADTPDKMTAWNALCSPAPLDLAAGGAP